MAIIMMISSILKIRDTASTGEFSQSFKYILKYFASLYCRCPLFLNGMYEITSRRSRKLIADIILLVLHCSIILLLNVFYQNIPLIALICLLEVTFYFSNYMIRIRQFSILYAQDIKTAIIAYFIDFILVLTPKIFEIMNVTNNFSEILHERDDQNNTESENKSNHKDVNGKSQSSHLILNFYLNWGTVMAFLTLLIHFVFLITLIIKNSRSKNHLTLINEADDFLLVNLRETDAHNASLNNSSRDEEKQMCLIAYQNTIKLIQITFCPRMMTSKAIDDPIQVQNVDNKNNLIPFALSEVASSVQIQPNLNKNNQLDEKQLVNNHSQFQRDKSMTLSKMTDSINPKYKLEDEPTVRKNKLQYESPSIIPILSTNNPQASNNRIYNGNTNMNISNNNCIGSQNINTQPNSQSYVLTKIQNLSQLVQSPSKTKSRIAEEIIVGTEVVSLEVINTIEIKSKQDQIELISFHEESQQLLVKVVGAVLFYQIPDFKKKKSVLLDSSSEYIFNKQAPTCIQYHYQQQSKQFQFTILNLSKETITKDDMKYSSITMNHPECSLNGLLLLGTFGSHDNSNGSLSQMNSKGNQMIFIRDGNDLITVNVESLAMEIYENKFENQTDTNVKITQLNKRQVVINSPNLLKQIIFDIPTNICYKIITDFPLPCTVLPITNLQNQVILNTKGKYKNSAVYDLLTKESMELPESHEVVSAQYIHNHLYIIDQTNSIKIFSFKGTSFNLNPPSEGGISCISVMIQ